MVCLLDRLNLMKKEWSKNSESSLETSPQRSQQGKKVSHQIKPTRKESVPPNKANKERKKPTRLNFEDDITGAPSDELSQKTVMGATGGETLPNRDITDYEWAMQYIDSNKKVVLVTTRNKGSGQIGKERPFMYGRLLRLDYEDSDST